MRASITTAARRIEGIANGGMNVLALAVDFRVLRERRLLDVFRSPVQGWIVADDDRRAAGDGQVDADVEVSPGSVMTVGHLDEHATPHDAVIELFQPAHTLANVRLDVVTMREAVKRHLGWDESHIGLAIQKAMQAARQRPSIHDAWQSEPPRRSLRRPNVLTSSRRSCRAAVGPTWPTMRSSASLRRRYSSSAARICR
jgi:hypothetical protein